MFNVSNMSVCDFILCLFLLKDIITCEKKFLSRDIHYFTDNGVLANTLTSTSVQKSFFIVYIEMQMM